MSTEVRFPRSSRFFTRSDAMMSTALGRAIRSLTPSRRKVLEDLNREGYGVTGIISWRLKKGKLVDEEKKFPSGHGVKTLGVGERQTRYGRYIHYLVLKI